MDPNIPEQQLKALRLGNPMFSYREYQNKKLDNNNDDDNDDVDEGFYNPYKNNKEVFHHLKEFGDDSVLYVGDLGATVESGDVLYHPAGVWHKVECLEDSITINISMIASSIAEIFCSNLQQLLCSDTSGFWRQPPDLRDPESYLQKLHSHIRGIAETMNDIDARSILPKPTLTVSELNSNRQDDNDDDDKDEDEDEDEDEEEDENDGDREGSNVIKLDASKSAGKNMVDLDAEQYKVNPFATLIAETCLYNNNFKLDGTKRWIVNVGYGNESLESVSRTVIEVSGADITFPTKRKKIQQKNVYLIDLIHRLYGKSSLDVLSARNVKECLQDAYGDDIKCNDVYIMSVLNALHDAGYLSPLMQ